ncbi:MAG: GAF domain-containing protein [Chloroflexi bacterium]|nr:MAG: GAF domain-containing protein [Chloroflexota bacterium]
MSFRRFPWHDLRWQLLAFFLLFVAPIFAVAVWFRLDAGQRLRADVSAADLSLARAIALETDAMLLKARDAVSAFAQTPAVIQADPQGMEEAFAAAAAARQDINLFYRLSADGIMLYHYPSSPRSTVGQDFSFREYFKAARATGQHVFSKGRISPTTGRPVATSVMPVFVNGRFDGVVAINLELQRLTETIQRISRQLPRGEGVKIIIVDTTGQVIAHTNPDNLLVNVSEILPGVREVLSGQEGSLTATDGDGATWLYTYTPVPISGWGVIVQRSARLAFASLDSVQQGLLWTMLLFGVGALFFWVVLSHRVIGPLVWLSRYGEAVGEDAAWTEQGRRAILPIAARRDQIGRLTRALLNAEQHIRRRLMELTTLSKTGAAVVSTLDTEQVIDTILEEVQHLLSVRQCSLLVLNEDTQQLEVRASRGLSPAYPPVFDLADMRDLLPACRAIVSGQPVHVPNVETDRAFAPLLPLARAEGYRSLLVIPLKAPHIPRAALSIYRADVHHFSAQEIDLATTFANFAAVALEHATLFSLTDAELQKRVRFLSALNRVGYTVSQSLVVDDVLTNAMDAVFQVMPVDACWIYLQREGEAFLRLRAHRGLAPDVAGAVQSRHLQAGEGVSGQIWQTGQSLLLNGAELADPQWQVEPVIAAGQWQSLAAAPVSAKERIIGVVGIAARHAQAFTAAEMELLEAIGHQIGIAVVNARLYRRSREIAVLEERNRLAREIHDTLAQGFTGILVQLQAAERLSLKRPELARQSLQEARELARQSLQEARRSVLNLRPTALENHTLDQVLADHVRRFEQETGITARFILQGYPNPLQPEVEQNLYRIAQEALTNVRRHAQASRVTVTLAFEERTVCLSVVDNGIGLGKLPDGNGQQAGNGRSAGPPADKNGGFGLVGIRERAGLMKGWATFNSPTQGGTEVKVVVPK